MLEATSGRANGQRLPMELSILLICRKSRCHGDSGSIDKSFFFWGRLWYTVIKFTVVNHGESISICHYISHDDSFFQKHLRFEDGFCTRVRHMTCLLCGVCGMIVEVHRLSPNQFIYVFRTSPHKGKT